MEQPHNKDKVKKPFDKRKWRENKYSKKVKVDRWKENRERSMKRKYFKMLSQEKKKLGPVGNVGKNANLEPLGQRKPKSTNDEDGCSSSKASGYIQAQLEFQKRQMQADKKQKQEEKREKYIEKQHAIKAYREKKAERFKVLSKKNRKGQPIMAGRIELLLDKIKKTTGGESQS